MESIVVKISKENIGNGYIEISEEMAEKFIARNILESGEVVPIIVCFGCRQYPLTLRPWSGSYRLLGWEKVVRGEDMHCNDIVSLSWRDGEASSSTTLPSSRKRIGRDGELQTVIPIKRLRPLPEEKPPKPKNHPAWGRCRNTPPIGPPLPQPGVMNEAAWPISNATSGASHDHDQIKDRMHVLPVRWPRTVSLREQPPKEQAEASLIDVPIDVPIEESDFLSRLIKGAKDKPLPTEEMQLWQAREARATADRLSELANQKRRRAEVLTLNADLAVFRAKQAIAIAEAANTVGAADAANTVGAADATTSSEDSI